MEIYDATTDKGTVSDEQSDDSEYDMTNCIVCSRQKSHRDYKLHVRQWDGKYVATAHICAKCVTDESVAWLRNQVVDR